MKNKSVLPLDKVYKNIKVILKNTRAKSFKAVNTVMAQAFTGI